MIRRIESFDVFDTLMTRCVIQPADLFLLLGVRLQTLGLVTSVSDFYLKRIEAEREALKLSEREDVKLSEIYTILANSMGWTEGNSEIAMQEELKCENNALVPIDALCKVVYVAEASGARVIGISDSYLPLDFVTQQIMKHISTDNFHLYISSEIGLTKHSSNLFKYVAQQEAAVYTQWSHRGDNRASDVEVPSRLGIKSSLVDTVLPNRYEIGTTKSSKEILASTLSGCMRATRLSKSFENSHYQCLWDTSCDVVGPAFLGYCYWLLSSADKDGVRRLYFVARDGQILLKLCKTIQRMTGKYSNIECRYLYGSRQAWHLPAVSEVDSQTIEWLFDETAYLSVSVILQRLGQSNNAVPKPVLALIIDCIPQTRWDKNLENSERIQLRKVFQRNELILDWIAEIGKQTREGALAYFVQEGLTDGTTWAMVDIGWNGRLQYSLSKILSIAGCKINTGIRGYYWALRTRTPYQENDTQISFADALPKKWRHTVFYHSGLYEAFASANHGSTVGYIQMNDGWEPVLRDSKADELTAWGVQHLQDGAVAFSTNFLKNYVEEFGIFQYMNLVLPTLDHFFRHPSQKEVDCFQARSMYECQTESSPLSLISPLSGWSMLKYWLRGKNDPNHGLWVHAYINSQPMHLKILLRLAFFWKRMIQFAVIFLQRKFKASTCVGLR